MRKLFFVLSIAVALFGADDSWTKVKDLKSGTELHVYKKGAPQALNVKMGDLNDENLIVIDGKKETAIAREEIERIDARPSGKSRVTTESKVTTKDVTGDPKAVIPSRTSRGGGNGPTTDSSTGVQVGSKGDFETVYRRPTGGPAKK